jgi:hypothetical protein
MQHFCDYRWSTSHATYHLLTLQLQCCVCMCSIVRTHNTVQNASLVGRCVQAEVDGEASCIGRVTACYPAQDEESLYMIE